jgi:hypothetical protein
MGFPMGFRPIRHVRRPAALCAVAALGALSLLPPSNASAATHGSFRVSLKTLCRTFHHQDLACRGGNGVADGKIFRYQVKSAQNGEKTWLHANGADCSQLHITWADGSGVPWSKVTVTTTRGHRRGEARGHTSASLVVNLHHGPFRLGMTDPGGAVLFKGYAICRTKDGAR